MASLPIGPVAVTYVASSAYGATKASRSPPFQATAVDCSNRIRPPSSSPPPACGADAETRPKPITSRATASHVNRPVMLTPEDPVALASKDPASSGPQLFEQ